ncbi:MAG: 23S rRNA (adenine(2503)-C(2))-methyltransferase RlmN [Solirubrobacterales bacterium]|nr:23S rRNA (adenine(2503)-C(2))-methyltransferase RlmN [Solirubrobacterales bacterium]MCB8971073.1 23S rRNA (adenine(2503)-C(2))-methyltransferase RlmN [Thermoleophilales bacterium]
MDLRALDNLLAERGEPAFRSKQVWEWLARGAASYEEMTNLPAALREALAAELPISTLELEREVVSEDGTRKALFATADGRPLETVLMSYRDGRRSICVSSQSGCPLTCAFCATGRMAFGRNLTASEIVDQALHFRRRGEVNHCVFMGMGEPLMNLDAVIEACERLPDVGIATSHTTVSTVGWVPGIERLATDGPRVRLALSLHSAEPDVRSSLMPVNDRYPLDEVLQACLRWREARGKRVYIEYLMLAGVNDGPDQALVLAEALKPHEAFKVNLIPFNPTPGELTGSSPNQIAAFRSVLQRSGLPTTVRLTRGRDIAAACGQLAAGGPGTAGSASSIGSRPAAASPPLP